MRYRILERFTSDVFIVEDTIVNRQFSGEKDIASAVKNVEELCGNLQYHQDILLNLYNIRYEFDCVQTFKEDYPELFL